MPWPSTSTIHFVPFPRLVFPTAAPLFSPTRSCHPETFHPIAATVVGLELPATAAMLPAKHHRLPTAGDDVNRSHRWDTRREGRANAHPCAAPTKCLPHTADSTPTVGPSGLAAASVRERNAQSADSAAPSASCQQLSRVPLSRVSTCLEAEPIYETGSRQK